MYGLTLLYRVGYIDCWMNLYTYVVFSFYFCLFCFFSLLLISVDIMFKNLMSSFEIKGLKIIDKIYGL